MTKLFTHPWHTNDNATFEREYECWFANMCTNKCGGLEPNKDRREPLSKKCTDNDIDWLQVWKEFSDDEVHCPRSALTTTLIGSRCGRSSATT